MINNLFDISGKVAIVTGGNGGIGLGIATGLANAGANIVIAARNDDKTSTALKSLSKIPVQSVGLHVDVQDEGSVAKAVESTMKQFGRIDILVNNAGINNRKQPQEFSSTEWDEVMDINLRGSFFCAREVYPHMLKCGGGKIINIGSMTSTFGLDFASVYAASKGGIVQLAKSQALAWAKDNIQVNCILPGWIKTELTSRLQFTKPERYSLVNKRIPAGRWGEPDDFAGIAVFLASPASDYVTGIAIPIDGGYTAF